MRGIPFRVIPIQDRPFNDLHFQSGPLWPLRSLWPLWPCWPYGGPLGPSGPSQAAKLTSKLRKMSACLFISVLLLVGRLDGSRLPSAT